MYLVMVTKNGIIKKTSLEQYSRPRVNGINAIEIREDDQLLEAKLTTGTSRNYDCNKRWYYQIPRRKSKICG